MTDSLSRILDFVGASAVGVVIASGAGVEFPKWLVAVAAAVAYGTGKATSPGVPFMPKKAPPPVVAP